MTYPIHDREQARLAALRRHELLDTPPEPELDQLVSLVAQALDVPIVLISLVDEDRQWFKAKVGLDVDQTPRDVSFCTHAVAADAPLVVADAKQDRRFRDNALVLEEPNIRFYAGIPLHSEDGLPLGTLCAIDRVPRELTASQHRALAAVARIAEEHLKLRRRLLLVEHGKDLRRFVEMAIHDLKNPLYIIMTLASLLKASSGVHREEADFLEELLTASRQLNSRMVSVLDLVADVDGAGMALERRWVRPRDLVADVVGPLRRTAAARQIAMEMRHEGEDEGILVDVSVLERALENLVHHAIKHAPSRSTIAVSVRNADAAVQFLVEDEGEGIPDADRKRLFDPFQRGDLPEHGSLGLGLAFCKAAAERHGGHIWIEDGAQGRGTRIVLQIPDAPTD